MEMEPMNEAATLDHDLQEENVTLATKERKRSEMSPPPPALYILIT
ncbi:hypothetical protein QTP86_030679 [Hemibagrus guttatus]|nr:hypothetical protein QTP86_030679 [Hemibagrus guttatus]